MEFYIYEDKLIKFATFEFEIQNKRKRKNKDFHYKVA